MRYEGVSFNVKAIKKHSDVNAFVESPASQRLWPKLSKEQRDVRLKDVWELSKYFM